ncbi:DUF1000-domain-containing protein [Lentinula raphanica]|nr:DUF1000-domain-containing protein [Lentinula raphanica]
MPYSSSSSSAAGTFKGGERTNLWRYIDRNNVRGLNLSNPDSAPETIKDWNLREDLERFADSSVDNQVIIHVPFSQNVRLCSVLLKLGTDETAPSRLRIYANQPNIVDFSKAETTKAHFKIKLMQDVPRVVEYPLRTAAFASINSVSLFIVRIIDYLGSVTPLTPVLSQSESLGGKVSRIYYVGFKGEVIPLEKDKDPQIVGIQRSGSLAGRHGP